MRKIVLRCQSNRCDLPWLTIVNGTLVVVSRHNGEKHTNVFSLASLIRLVAASAQPGTDLQAILDEVGDSTMFTLLDTPVEIS